MAKAEKENPLGVNKLWVNIEGAEWFPPDDWIKGNVYQRKLWVTGMLARIKKGGELFVGGGRTVKTVTHDDLVSAIKPLLIRAGLDFTLQPVEHEHQAVDVVRRNGEQAVDHYHEVKMTGSLTNVDDPNDKIPLTAFGTGLDGGDKGYGKAVTYGKKYELLLLFLIETGNEHETDTGETPASVRKRPQPPTEAELQREATSTELAGQFRAALGDAETGDDLAEIGKRIKAAKADLTAGDTETLKNLYKAAMARIEG